MSYRTDYRRAVGLGSAREGVGHWWGQRISSIAALPLTVLFVIQFGTALGDGHATVVEIYSRPWNALIAILFFIVGFQHLKQGLQVVIEDYVHHGGAATALQIFNILFCWGLAAIGVFSVVRLSLIPMP